ncbi:hypothetical protein HOS78_gp061 [Lactobacillus phage Bacchae]|uniref:Uncharacterized protein n=1 Tax=Lactobacillus phage Bacchae TaxID=2079429 RepID=A0A2K9VCQ3_9CAUD|nr:hypothetical protein HOS78_gp061 [Lactobacillus phage Bacchae]AUV59997.1 hypothetical protein [Lactobacillus phage Bacchae]
MTVANKLKYNNELEGIYEYADKVLDGWLQFNYSLMEERLASKLNKFFDGVGKGHFEDVMGHDSDEDVLPIDITVDQVAYLAQRVIIIMNDSSNVFAALNNIVPARNIQIYDNLFGTYVSIDAVNKPMNYYRGIYGSIQEFLDDYHGMTETNLLGGDKVGQNL